MKHVQHGFEKVVVADSAGAGKGHTPDYPSEQYREAVRRGGRLLVHDLFLIGKYRGEHPDVR